MRQSILLRGPERVGSLSCRSNHRNKSREPRTRGRTMPTRMKSIPALAALAGLCLLCSDTAMAFTVPQLRVVRHSLSRMPAASGSVLRAHPRMPTSRGRAVAKAPFLSTVRAESDEALVPPPKEMAGAYVSSMDQYEQMYRQSLDDPEVCPCLHLFAFFRCTSYRHCSTPWRRAWQC